MHSIRKAVVAVAGSGTRLLPATKAQPKEMLPIVDKPIIQYLVEELVAAGIEDVVMVTRWDKKPLEDHFDRSVELEQSLKKAGKEEYLKVVCDIANLANFIYVRQKGPYGNGTPALSAASIVGDEPFVFAFGDDLVKSEVSFTAQLVAEYERYGCPVIGVQRVPKEAVERYGIVRLKHGTNEIEDIVEKPSVAEAPSQLAQFGRMILTREIVAILRDTPLGKGGELWITDAVRAFVRGGGVVRVKEVERGAWYTTGDPLNYLKTTIEYALDRKDIGGDLRAYLRERCS